MNYFPVVESWLISEGALAASLSEMARDGMVGNEGVAMWLGRRGLIAEVTHVVRLRGPGVVREPDHLHVHAHLLNDVADLAIEHEVSLLGQIHSHGPGYGVDLSLTDRRYGIAVPYFLSVVAPDYALRDETTLADCGLHVYERDHGFRRLHPPESADRVRVARGGSVTLLTAGGRG